MTAWLARNPATGAILSEHQPTSPAELADRVARLRAELPAWSAQPVGRRLGAIYALERSIARAAEPLATALVAEIGKTRIEARIELATTLDAIRWTRRHAASVLRERRARPGLQRLLGLSTARIRLRPHGLVGLIGTWNYPLLLNLAPLAQALAAGNLVLWKPSELATHVGVLTARVLDEAIPGLTATILGGPDIGAALIAAGIDHLVFTGGVTTGRTVLAQAGSLGLSATAELSGFDPAIVLPDAPLESTARALAWSAFVSAGQTCVATKRIYTIGDPSPWIDRIAQIAASLRLGDPSSSEVDLGPLIHHAARDRVHATVQAAIAAGARLITGGRIPDGHGSFYPPTVLAAETAQPEAVLAGIFGPVLLVRGVTSLDTAIAAANATSFGLAASVWGRDRRQLRAVASRLEAGMITLNEAVTPAGHAAAPFGGIKASGYGRTRGEAGLLALVQPQAIHFRRPGGVRPQLYPYGPTTESLLQAYLHIIHRTGSR
ncbi:MAG: putative succinate-semialdehyde dehydrogenase [NADP(+)] [Isosphaeraceae bacterium]|nr:MAG: putative succinate-semialdehyde dehydrogenase [NADP(+)] [Isosphaeraceae bacterium]